MATSLAIATEASEAPTPVQTPAAGGHLPSGTRLALGLLVVSTFVVILNETIMSVALASVGGTGTTTDHRLPAHEAIVIPTTGFLLQRFTTRQVFIAA